MDTGKLYFVKDEFYERFKGCGLLENKEIIDGKQHNRPCCYLFKFSNDNSDIYWMIPVSSKVSKYKTQYQKSIDKYGICDNISFGYILGEECAFLPQNLFPVTEIYINNIYIDKNTFKKTEREFSVTYFRDESGTDYPGCFLYQKWAKKIYFFCPFF